MSVGKAGSYKIHFVIISQPQKGIIIAGMSNGAVEATTLAVNRSSRKILARQNFPYDSWSNCILARLGD